MARGTGYIDYVKHKAVGMQIAGQCPVTCGLPTRMTEGGFARACAAKQQQGGEYCDDPKNRASKQVFAVRKKLNICATCRGENRPAELEILTLSEVTVGTKTKGQACTLCGKKDCQVAMNHGKEVCSSCSVLMAAVNLRPESVLAAINHLGKADFFAAAGRVEITATSEPLSLEDQAMQNDLLALRDLLGMPLARVSELVAAVGEMASAYERTSTRLEAIIKEQNVLADHCSELERDKAMAESSMEQCREALELDHIHLGELAGHIRGLRAAAGYYMTCDIQTGRTSGIQSLLLDLFLGVAKGEIQGLQTEQLEALRKVSA